MFNLINKTKTKKKKTIVKLNYFNGIKYIIKKTNNKVAIAKSKY